MWRQGVTGAPAAPALGAAEVHACSPAGPVPTVGQGPPAPGLPTNSTLTRLGERLWELGILDTTTPGRLRALARRT